MYKFYEVRCLPPKEDIIEMTFSSFIHNRVTRLDLNRICSLDFLALPDKPGTANFHDVWILFVWCFINKSPL